jgi:long-chain fatty acid transport protein
LLAAPAAASPVDVFGYGPRSSAMGATGAAIGSGAETTWSNPALLSLGRQRELTLGFEAARVAVKATGPGMPGDLHPDAMRGTLIAASLPLPLAGLLRDRVALGLAFYTPTNVVVRGRVLYPETPQFPLITDRLQSISIQGGLGLDLGRGIRVGVGVAALAAISGTVIVATDNSGSVGTKVDDQLVASYAAIVGASYDLGDSYRVGVTYRGSLAARFAVQIEVHDLGALTVPPFNIAGLAQYDPWQIQGEIARVKGPWKVAVGATFKRWSAYPGAPEPTVLCPPENPSCAALVPAPPGFHDTVVPRVGVEREIQGGEGWTVLARGGYFFEPSPVPEQKGSSRLFDNSRHALTLGGGLQLTAPLPLRVEIFGQYHLLAERAHHAEGSEALQATTSGSILMGGLTAGVAF